MSKKVNISAMDLQSPFLVAPENQGQMVTVAYAATEDYILEQITDASDDTVTITAFRYPADGSEDAGIEPWQEVPKLGRRVGQVNLTN